MPSPDVEQYLDLELVQLDEATLLAAALERAGLVFPDWSPREGNTEVVLLEQLATLAAETGYAINQLPNVLTEVLLRLFGATRDPGAPPTITATIFVSDTDGHTIPAGTTIRLELGGGLEPVDFTTTADLVIAPGDTSGAVVATGGDPTTAANGIPAGTTVEVLDALSYVNGGELVYAASGGRLAEDGAAFLDRAIPILSRLTTTLVRPADVEAFVAANPAVLRVKALDLYDPSGGGAPGTAPGFVTVAVAGPGGSSVGAPTRDLIRSQLIQRMHAGLMVAVQDANVNTVNVTVTVLRFASADSTAVQAAVTANVNALLNPDTWAWSNFVYKNDVVATADNAPGVDVVLDVVLDGPGIETADGTPLTGVAPLARAGTVTVVVATP